MHEPISKPENEAADESGWIVSTGKRLCALIRRMRLPCILSLSGRGVALLRSLCCTLPLLASCGSSGGGAAGPVGNVVIRDPNNYTSQSSLAVPTVQTAAGQDLTLSWGGVTQDLLCHPAGSIDNVAFLKIGNMMPAQVEAKLAIGKLTATEVTMYREHHVTGGDAGAGATSVMLSQLAYGAALDPATDYLESSSTQYLLLFTHGTTLAVGAQTMTFIQPTAGVQNVTVAAPNPCSSSGNLLSFSPTLSTMLVSIPVAGPWKIDWSQITKDNFGQTLDFSQTKLDKVEVAFFQGMAASDLQAHFLDIELNATSLYTVSVPTGQKYVDLAGAQTSGGTAFPGFTSTDGTWAAAVLCGTCSIPAPVVFVILQPQ